MVSVIVVLSASETACSPLAFISSMLEAISSLLGAETSSSSEDYDNLSFDGI